MRRIKPVLPSLLCAGLALATACSDDGGNAAPDAATPDAATPDANPIDAAPPGQAVTIRFAVKAGAQDVTCGDTPYEDIGTADSAVTLKDIRFYVSNVRLLAGADEVPVNLDQDGTWQYRDVALLDFEDGTAGCVGAGNTDTNDRVVGTVAPGTYDGIVFDLGVPYELNHADLAAAPSPLNVSAMYWAWALGHKFLRFDISVQGGTSWDVHLGSALCDSPSPTAPPPDGCDRPNRARIALADFDPATDTVVLDLAALLADSDLSTDAGGSPGCQSFPDDETECAILFPKLGLDFTTGECIDDCQAQSAFRVE